MVQAHHHRPTLKQQNKPFRSKHATKSSLKDAAKGRISRQSPNVMPNSNEASQLRLNRKNNAKQAQLTKRRELISATRIFNGVDSAPRVVAIVPLTADVSPRDAVCKLCESLQVPGEDCPETGIWKMRAERFKTSLQFILTPYKSPYITLDACKAADYVIFLLSSTVEVDDYGDTLLRILQAQGLPDVVAVVAADDAVESKARPGILKSLLSFVQYFVPNQTRVFDLHMESDKLNAVRALAEGRPGDVRWRDGRARVLGESVEWEDETLRVTGVVRGSCLSANRLVHLPGHGDFQISKIMSAPLPRPSKSGHSSMEVESVILAQPEPSTADSLVSTNDPDDIANEQTWPTEEEMEGEKATEGEMPEAQKGTTPKAVRLIPKGMSEYQASWIVDEDDDDDEENDDDEREGPDVGMEEVEDMEEVEEMQDVPMPNEDYEMETDSRRNVTFQDLDIEEEAKQLKSWRTRTREEETDRAFPDEMDTPDDTPARVRFQRFRGMRSFRTSPWDPFENLPRDYARIFQFEDFRRTERGVRKRAEQEMGIVEENHKPGTRVTVHLRDVSQEVAMAVKNTPTILFALLQHEHKVSVLNFTVQRNTEYDGSVRSKDPLVLCFGPRRLRVTPIYSQHTRGGGKGANNVHKFERYLQHGVTSVATTYGPVVFGKQPCVLLRETSHHEAPKLVAMGTFLNPDTTRIIAKRIILTGHPFKVHKKTATVRYMFFNSEDVQYFKPIQLYTKHGRTGHIRDSLGTHGYFKAHFDGPITQMDTVCMSLYKRVYPKWSKSWKWEKNETANTEDAMEE